MGRPLRGPDWGCMKEKNCRCACAVSFGLGMSLSCLCPTGLTLFLCAVILVAMGFSLLRS